MRTLRFFLGNHMRSLRGCLHGLSLAQIVYAFLHLILHLCHALFCAVVLENIKFACNPG